MSCDLLQPDNRRLYAFAIDLGPILMLREVALGESKALQKLSFNLRFCLRFEEVMRQLDYPPGILDDLNGFNSGDFVKKPATTRVHKHGMALKLHQLEDGDLLLVGQRMLCVFRKKTLHMIRGTVQNYKDVVVPRIPGGVQQLAGLLLEERITGISQPVESRAKASSPLLVPGPISSA